MGKALAKQITGMSWTARISLVLVCTLLASVFMYEGWYKPRYIEAATVTYGVTVPSTATVGIDGSANLSATGTITTTPTVRGLMSTTYTTSASSYRPTTGMTNGTAVTLLKLYSPVYATPTQITAPSGSFAVRGYNATDRWTAHLYAYNPNGTAGNKTLLYTSSTLTSGTGATVAFAPTYTAAASTTVPAGYRLLVEIVYTPGGATLTPRVYLDGTASTSWSRLTVTETALVAPTITSITPTSISTGAATSVTINGTNLSNATVAFTNGTVGTKTSNTATQIVVPITGTTVGTGTVTVTTAGGSTTGTLNVTSAAPTVTSISPVSMAQGGSGTLTINGSNLTGATLTVTGTGVTLGTITSNTGSVITVPVTVATTATVGARTLTVTTASGSTTTTFTVTGLPPTITSISPTSMPLGATAQTLTINGTNLTGATVTMSGAGVTVGAIASNTGSVITVPITVAATATTGARTLAVTTASGTTTTTFTVTAPAPTITTVAPSSITQGTATAITITGTNLGSALSISFSNGSVGTVTSNTATQIVVPITGTTVGTGTVTVTTAGGSATGTLAVTASTVCTRTAPTLNISAAGTVVAGGQVVYPVVVTNNDTAACGSSTFGLTLGAETGSPNTSSFTLPSVLGAGSTGAVAPGASFNTSLTVKATAAAVIGHVLTTPVNATDTVPANHAAVTKSVGTTVATVSWSNNPLLHNSQNMGSTKWAAGWGVPGGQYGAFTCTTCHNQTTANIKRVTTKVPAVFAPATTVNFRSTTTPNGFGDDSVAHTSSQKICEVCHTLTKYHNRNSANSVSLTHNNNSDCIACHPHNVAFKASGGGACDSCHGNPPTVATVGGPNGLALSNALPSGQAGAHATHVSIKGMTCNTCHNGAATAMPSGQMEIGFAVNPTTFPGFQGTVTTGAYVGNSLLTGATWASSSTGTTVTTAANTNTCAVYCHGSTLTPASTNTPASWVGGTAEAQCGMCHGTSSATPPTTGSHTRHAGSGAGGLAIVCANCHAAHPDNSHINGNVSWDLTLIAANAQYKTPTGAYATVGSTGGLAPSASYGTCNTIYCHSNSGPNGTTPVYGTPTWGGATLSCGSCHADMSTVSSTAPNGGHYAHASTTNTTGPKYSCTNCHAGYTATTVAAATHTNKLVETAITGVTYSKPYPQPAGTAWGTCNAVSCHGSATALVWGGTLFRVGTDACSTCHSSAAAGAVTAAVPFYRTGATKVTATTDAKVGFHTTHVTGVASQYNAMTCDACHGAVTFATTTHMNSATTFTWNALAATGGLTPTYNAATGQCSNVYCHGVSLTAATTANRTPAWNVALLTGVATNDCGKCHGYPPATATHTGVTATACITCHTHVNATGTGFTNVTLHINGVVDASGGDCIGCHGAAVSSPIAAALDATVATRPNIVADFSLASNHIRSRTTGTGVTNADCCVCHMEGDVATASPNATYHKNGYIELRDPDTGLTIKGVTHSGTTTAAGAYASTTTDARFVRFSRNLGSATIEANTAAMMVNHCLKCHDSNGAVSTTARITGGTAFKPFANTVAANGTNQGVLDVATQFASTNRSFHPVLVRQNSGYTNTGGTRMVAPWNGVAKTGTTTTYGPLITCWDCHAPNGTASTVTLTSSGVHGGAKNGTDNVPLRGNVYTNSATTTNATNLCTYCHVVSGGTTNHGTGSAITSSTNSGMTYFANRCFYCHSGATGTAKPARPIPAADAHGFSTRANGTAFTAANHGYAFIRSEGWYSNTAYYQSIRSIGATTYTPTCTGYSGACSRTSMGGYTPGGVY